MTFEVVLVENGRSSLPIVFDKETGMLRWLADRDMKIVGSPDNGVIYQIKIEEVGSVSRASGIQGVAATQTESEVSW